MVCEIMKVGCHGVETCVETSWFVDKKRRERMVGAGGSPGSEGTSWKRDVVIWPVEIYAGVRKK